MNLSTIVNSWKTIFICVKCGVSVSPYSALTLVAIILLSFDLGCQDNKVTGRKADVVMAAHMAAEAALRLVKPTVVVRLRYFRLLPLSDFG